MSKCSNCRLRKETAKAFDLHWLGEDDCPYEKCPIPAPKTNADRIRAMTDEEIVVCMMKHDVMPTEVKKRLADGAFETRSDALLWWLKQECEP